MEELRSFILTALSTLGVDTTHFLAIVGAAGLAIGLALKDSLLERIKRVLDKYSLSIPAEQRLLPGAAQTVSK